MGGLLEALDASGNPVLAGDTTGDLFQSLVGTRDMWLMKLDQHATLQWGIHFARAGGYVMPRGVRVDSTGNIVVTGGTDGALPSGSISANPFYGGQDMFVAKFSAAGALQWCYTTGGAGWDRGAVSWPK